MVVVVGVAGLGALGGAVEAPEEVGGGRLKESQERQFLYFRHCDGEGSQLLHKSKVIVVDDGW